MWTHELFCDKSETTFTKQFCNLHSKMSKNMCKWHHKVRNGSILPPWIPNFWYYFVEVYLQTIELIFSQIWDLIIKTVFSTHFFCFLFQAPRYLKKTFVNGVTNWKTSRRAFYPFYLVKWSLIYLTHFVFTVLSYSVYIVWISK